MNEEQKRHGLFVVEKSSRISLYQPRRHRGHFKQHNRHLRKYKSLLSVNVPLLIVLTQMTILFSSSWSVSSRSFRGCSSSTVVSATSSQSSFWHARRPVKSTFALNINDGHFISRSSKAAFVSTFVAPPQLGLGPSSCILTSSKRCSSHSTKDSTERVSSDMDNTNTDHNSSSENDSEKYLPPWSIPSNRTPQSKNVARFRQHVNPLSRRFQMPTDLPDRWPTCDFANVNLPLYLDIGCGKGGFLLDMVQRRHGSANTDVEEGRGADTTSEWLPTEMNYLGLEIRPGVSQYAQARVEKRGLSGKLSFVGCNANVDLERLLTLYQEAATSDDGDANVSNNRLAFVSIQFPDPHFKKQHTKRRVVTPALVDTLAKFMESGDVVFLQSDIKDALVAMREKFCEENGKLYFVEIDGDTDKNEGEPQEYNLDNPLGIPTEREISVLDKGLPVYRTMFRRNDIAFS